MKFSSSQEHGSTELAEINIIPLVDIMLVLLIIFMVTAPLLEQSINVDIPEVTTTSTAQTEEKDLILAIRKDGAMFLGEDQKTQYTLETLEEKLAEIVPDKEKKEIYLKADKLIPYGEIVRVMAACQRAGIVRVGMITRPEDE